MSRYYRLLLIGAALVLVIAGHVLLSQTPGGAPVATQFEQLHFRSIGPASMSGRITDFAVYEANPSIYYVGSSHGGLWKTVNNGLTFTPQFQDLGLMSVGDVTISQSNPDLVWLGTGEGNARQSISWGDGVYKSTDGGKSFKNMGLRASYHINRIVIDPNDNNVVFVAAQGPLFGPGGDRGVYKTTDGGATWKPVLQVDDLTGANDLAMDPTNSKILYASTWQRQRSQCCFNGGGPGSGIWKSTDSGEKWTRLTAGLPKVALGRVGLDVYRKSPNILYASIEAENPAAAAGGRGGGGGGGMGGGGAAGGETGLYRSDDGGASWQRVNSANPRPMYFSQVRVDPNSPDRVLMGGVGLHMTIDGGKTIETDAAQATHDDVHAIWIDPANSNHILIGNDGGVSVSYDGSHTWQWLPNLPVGTFYHVGYDLEYPFNVCGGLQDNYDWCGPSAVRFRAGISNDKWQTVQGGDGFVAIIDQRDSRIVYTESQDGNMTRKNRVTGESKNIRPTPENVTPAPAAGERYRFNWDTPMIFSPHDPGTLYVAAQVVFKSTDRGDSWMALSPDLTTNANRNDMMIMGVKDSDVRISRNDGIANWPTIVSLAESPKQPGIFYTGTDDGVVSMTRDTGKTWQNITDKIPGFPKGAWVSEVVPSRFDAGTVYVTVDAHRLNDFSTYIWASNDFGATFRSLNSNLKGEVVKTLTEDLRNQDALYIGTETGIFLTLDRGKSWARLKANFPTVRVDEITLHPRDNAMLVATHGRSLWILDHLEPIQEYAAAQNAAADAKLFSIGPALQWKSMDDKNDEFWGHQYFLGENPPFEAMIQYSLKKQANDVKLKITDNLGKDVRELTLTGNKLQAGIQTGCWDTRVEPIPANIPAAAPGQPSPRGGGAPPGQPSGRGGRGPVIPGIPQPQPEAGYMPVNPCGGGGAGGGRGGGGGFGGGGGNAGPFVLPGTYNVALLVDGKTVETKPIKIIADPESQLNDVQRKRYTEILMDLHEMQRKGTPVQQALNSLFSQMTDVAAKVKDSTSVPAAVKTQFAAFNKEFDAVRVKFGVPQAVGGGGRGGGPGGGAPAGGRGGAPGAAAGAAAPAAVENTGGFNPAMQGGFGGGRGQGPGLINQASSLKGQIGSFWEMPSDALLKQYNDLKLAIPKAMLEANAFLAKVPAMSDALKKYDITLTAPAPIK
ncbi:MAG: hypothetical protein LAP85_08100 [Acidobacteriia bacterium]|nr:hypothetical protein [Terriglobia bacterium]